MVIADSVRTGGHEWPTNTNNRINISEKTWAFLKRFSLKDGVSVLYPQRISSGVETVSFSYSAGIIHFKGISEQSHVQVVDTKGRIIANKTVNQSQIDSKVKVQGLYLLRINNKDI
jgi:hypothetical protein